MIMLHYYSCVCMYAIIAKFPNIGGMWCCVGVVASFLSPADDGLDTTNYY